MTNFEAKVMAELLCFEELRAIGRVGWDRCVRAELERARQEQFVRRVLEERLYVPQRERFRTATALVPSPPRPTVINQGYEFQI
jgi:hypothetical protein